MNIYLLAITPCYSQVVALFFLTQSDTCKHGHKYSYG